MTLIDDLRSTAARYRKQAGDNRAIARDDPDDDRRTHLLTRAQRHDAVADALLEHVARIQAAKAAASPLPLFQHAAQTCSETPSTPGHNEATR